MQQRGEDCEISSSTPTKISALSHNSSEDLNRYSPQVCDDIPLEFMCSMNESMNTDNKQTTYLRNDDEEDCDENLLAKHLLLVHASYCEECQFMNTKGPNLNDAGDSNKRKYPEKDHIGCGPSGCGPNRCASHRTDCEQKYTKRASLKHQRFSKPPVPAPISVPSDSTHTNTNNSFDSGINSSHGTPKSATNSQHMQSFDSCDPVHDDCQRMINTPPPAVLHHDWKTEVIFPQQSDCNNKWAAAVTVFMALSLFLGIIAFMIVFFATKGNESDSDVPMTYNSLRASAALKLNLTYKEAYGDATSQEYNELRSDMLSMLDSIFRNSTLKQVYMDTVFNGFRAGSVYVDVTIILSSLPKAVETFPDDTRKEWTRKEIQNVIDFGSKNNIIMQNRHAKLEAIFVTDVILDSTLTVETTQSPSSPTPLRGTTDNKIKPSTASDDLFVEVLHHDILNQDQCGYRNSALSRFRIIGGYPALSGAWPWIGSMDYAVVGHKCAASLIAPEWAITAAHCVTIGRDAILQNITFGDLSLEDPSPYHQEIPVEEIYSHPGFSPLHKDHDIAVLKLAKPVQMYAGHVMPVCLETNYRNWDQYKQCFIAGWGVKEVSGNISVELQEARLPLVPKVECHNQYNLSPLPSYNVITDNMICAGTDDGSVDACQSDSGGPLVCQRESDKWHMVGVTSFGMGCGHPNFSGVYARVSRYREFILSVVDGDPSVLCEPIDLDGCRGILPYSHTYVTSQTDYKSTIERLLATTNTTKSRDNTTIRDYRLFMCSVFLPRCTHNPSSGVEVTKASQLTPCLEFCRRVEQFVKDNDMSWSYIFITCADFPFAMNRSAKLCESKERNLACGLDFRFNISHGSHKVLKSPYYPASFLNSLDCSWFITSPLNTYILIKFHQFGLSECCDVVSIGEGTDIYNRTTVRRRLRGGSKLTPMVAHSNHVWLRLQSDEFVETKEVFSMEFHTIFPQDANDPCKSIEHSSSAIFTKWRCDGIVDCASGEDEEGCDRINKTTSAPP
ncbi:uncharacterized protein [Amphiura filiformis]|uniref:uncharacterized protein n=1 Tax=Amphiura filiformis TaxID=82378 RepID=UPI003B20D21A